ncbi:hypothetical protein [Acidovorax soli]|uniref:Uncharacterized protein n=1 Tax=Acidovorax soli TaxID=592050 RepID=A0A1H4BNI9_9BURK|nr:hypothetical protein SAMN05421875_11537 [Acidovorax soli]
MSELSVPRPVLRTFRVLAFSGQNKGDAAGMQMQMQMQMQMNLQQEIDLALAVPIVAGAGLMLGVMIKLQATAANPQDVTDVATFSGEYEAKFFYSSEVSEKSVAPLLEDNDYQYVLVAQAYPLAMTHFRRELQAMGLDARELPLGLA